MRIPEYICSRPLKLTIAATLSTFALLAPASANTLICSVEMLAGLTLDRPGGKWRAGTAKPPTKYLLRNSTEPNRKYEVVEFGSPTVLGFCGKEFERDELQCSGFDSEFFFSKADMRFIRTYTWGYWNEKSLNAISPNRREGADTP